MSKITQLTAVINNSDHKANLKAIAAVKSKAQALELRIDALTEVNKKEIADLMAASNLPVIFTLRKQAQGGQFTDSQEKQKEILLSLIDLKPQYIDLEYDTPLQTTQEILERSPETQLICSVHILDHTPESIEEYFLRLKCFPAHIYKIVTYANTLTDSLKMIRFVIANRRMQKNIIGLCMGDQGKITRLLSPVIGNYFNYAYVDHPSASGQYSAEEMETVYHHDKLDEQSQIFALLGENLSASRSHLLHNQMLDELAINALYIKISLSKGELKSFFSLIKGLPFAGFSVTMPHKEEILAYIDLQSEESQAIGAVNTIAIGQDRRLIGSNTDGIGAIEAIEEKTPIKDKKIVILGAGGAAKAIAYIAKERGARVTMLNRTEDKAKHFTQTLGIEFAPISNINQIAQEGYDILVNATSVGMLPEPDQMPIPSEAIIPSAIIMDIVQIPSETKLLREAKAKGCPIIYGHEMFIRQAAYQYERWFGDKVQRFKVVKSLEKIFKKIDKENPID